MGIEKINQAQSANKDSRAQLAAMEEAEGHNGYTEIFDNIVRDPKKAQTIIAQALKEKAEADIALVQAMNAAGYEEGESVTGSAKEVSDALLDKLTGKID